jgi:hypothetical protein
MRASRLDPSVLNPVTSLPLRLITGCIGGAQQLSRGAAAADRYDAYAHTDAERAAAAAERVISDGPAEQIGQAQGLCSTAMLEQYAELIPT